MVAVPDNLFPYSTGDSIKRDVAELRASFRNGALRDLATRRRVLLQLRKMLHHGQDALTAALHKDLHKCMLESRMSEISMVDIELQEHLDYLEDWAAPEKVPTNLPNLPGHSFIQRDPLGVVCIIGTWNYPVQLTLQPLVGAIAAGNCVLLRLPGDDSCVHTNNVLIELLEEFMDKRFVRYVHGGVDESKTMLEQNFDLIFCTGGEFIGKIVAQAAAKTLTPTILELGGKSPAIVDETCDLDVCARRLAWGSFLNAGQTCVRPDYVLVHHKIGDQFVLKLKHTLRSFFGEDPQKSESYGRLINSRAFERVSGLLAKDKDRITLGGQVDAADRFIAPTLLNFATDKSAFLSSACMSQEIFGPLLPIHYYQSLDDALDIVRDGAKPLALYVYTSNSTTRNRVLSETSSGSVCVNDAIMQLSNPHLPFGGVGNSGMGAYHGKHSFDAFSHKKSVLVRSTWLDVKERYYPYTERSAKIMLPALRPISRRTKRSVKYLAYAIGLAILAASIKYGQSTLAKLTKA
ncbi:hypothetical protein ATCC90586_010058 [Pythium insidiosum]|nr:hypothetical protein ATCC90586_010058 [Pythium insidiosum]